MKTKKILYLFSDTGGGHRSAAKAIIQAVTQASANKVNQKMVDVFSVCHPLTKSLSKLYGPISNNFPWLWKILYGMTNNPKKISQMEKMSYPFILKAFKKLLRKEKPNLIISVHPLVNHLTIRALKELKMKVPFVVVVTDPVTLHRTWVMPEADLMIVATDKAKQLAVEYGCPKNKVKVFGMPIELRFAENVKKALELRKKRKKFTALIMGGGEGMGNIYNIVKELNRAEIDMRLIVIAGRNKKLESRLRKNQYRFPIPMDIYGFTNEVPEIVTQVDLLITKAGPGSVAEAWVMYLPLIINAWIPGQEEGNVEFVIKENLGRVTTNPKEVPRLLKEIMNKKVYNKIVNNIERVRKPKASLMIARTILKYL